MLWSRYLEIKITVCLLVDFPLGSELCAPIYGIVLSFSDRFASVKPWPCDRHDHVYKHLLSFYVYHGGI